MSFQIRVPTRQSTLNHLRESVFFKLAQQMLQRAEKKKGERLNKQEVDEYLGELRAKLEKMGFFESGAGIR